LNAPFKIEELKQTISKAKNNKAPGRDGIPSEFFKCLNENSLDKLLLIFTVRAMLQRLLKKQSFFQSTKKGT
jgi:hypothetical protein